MSLSNVILESSLTKDPNIEPNSIRRFGAVPVHSESFVHSGSFEVIVLLLHSHKWLFLQALWPASHAGNTGSHPLRATNCHDSMFREELAQGKTWHSRRRAGLIPWHSLRSKKSEQGVNGGLRSPF